MKKIYSFLILLILTSVAYAQFPGPYCPVNFSSGIEPITAVQFADIENLTSGTSAHVDFTGISATVNAEDSYIISVNGNTSGNYTNFITVFIDWNQDGNFDGPNETYQIGTLNNNPGNGTPASSTIVVPTDAIPGLTRMRVTKRDSEAATSCNSTGYGQAQDYTLIVSGGDSCNDTPVINAVNSSATSICSETSFILDGDVTPTVGYSYQWEASIDNGINWNALGAPRASASFNITSQTETTVYRLIVSCTSANLSATSMPIEVIQNPEENCHCLSDFIFMCDDGDVILNVTFGSIDNDSDCSLPTGYTDYSNAITPALIEAGTSESISVTVGDGWLTESVGVWIDFNKNGVFDETEFFYIGTGSGEILADVISIPSDAVLGITRMRVIVYSSPTIEHEFNCGPSEEDFGEIEDYAIEITPALGIIDLESAAFTMHPNPTNGVVTLTFKQATAVESIAVYSITGQLVFSNSIDHISAQYNLDLNDTADGLYLIKIQTEDGILIKQLVKK